MPQTPEKKREWARNRDPETKKHYLDLRHQKAQDLVRQIKTDPCLDCGRTYHYSIMDFDHVRGEKKYNIASLVSRKASTTRVISEIEKCDLVCANCHRLRTWLRMQESDER